MRKVKWGVLGTADIAKGCTIPGMLLSDCVEMVAIAGRNKEKAELFKETYGFKKAYDSYDALLDDEEIEAVYIPLPNHLHYEWVMKAMKKGKHVLCEKPMPMNEKEAVELFQAAEENHVFLMEAFAYLHSPYVKQLKEDVSSGIIGEIDYIESAFLTISHDLTNVRMHKEMYGGSVYDLGVYATSLILTLMGENPVTVTGVADYTEEGIDEFATAFLKFKNGARANVTCGMNLSPKEGSRFDRTYIHGDKGYIKSDVPYNAPGELSYTIVTKNQEITRTVTAPQNYMLEVDQLSRCIVEGEKPYVTKEFSIMNAKLVEDILKAISY